jgi:flagellar motor protein MotB
MRFTILIFALLLFVLPAQGQSSRNSKLELTPEMLYSVEGKYNSWSVSGAFGPLFMYTDLSDYSFFPSGKINFGPSLLITKHLFPSMALELQYLQGNMNGEKGLYAFEGDLQDFSINGIVVINQLLTHPGPINDKWNYYVKFGLGATLFRNRLLNQADGSVVRKADLYGNSSDLFEVKGYQEDDPTRKTSRQNELVMPLGAGVMYRINKNFDVGLESTMRFSLEDDLENILTGSTNDRYLFTALNVSYKIGRKNKRHLRWTHRGYDMNLFGRPKKDPRLNELEALEAEVAQYAKNRPINKDSVVIIESLKIIYNQFNVRSLFFNPGSAISSFSTEDQILMSEVAVELLKHPEYKVVLYGYSDPSSESGKDLRLSEQRAESVKDFLVSEVAVRESQIRIVPKGDLDPLSPTEKLSPRGLKMANRRVDMVIER